MTRLKPGTAAFTLLLGVLIGLQLLGMAITLPILPTITADLGATPESTQLTISAFLIGIAVSQIAYGALTDRYGRKPVVLGGVAVYGLCAVGCAAAPSIEWLIGLRALQGVGAAAGVVVVRAIIRDLFQGTAAVQMLSRIGMLLSAIPMVAPLLGGWLLPWTGWRGIFLVLAAASLVALAAGALLLDESIRHRDTTATDPRRLLANCWRFICTPGCPVFVLMVFCVNGAMYGYSATSAFVLMTGFGISSAHYGWFLTMTGTSMVAGSLAGDRIARVWSIRRTLGVATAWTFLAGLAALACTQFATRQGITGPAGIALVIVPMLFYAFAVGAVFANSTAAALQPVPEIAGVASALAGSAQMLGAGFFAWLGGHLFDGTPATVGYGVGIGGTLAFVLYNLLGRRHAPEAR